MARSKVKRRHAARPVELPEPDGRPRWVGVVTWLAVGVVAAGGALWVAKQQAESGSKQVAPPPVGLPHTPDYHALLVSPTDARAIVLGTHAGLYVSSDGGRTWQRGQLAGNDAMNLVRPEGGALWAAGHNVLFRSQDRGETWEEVHPSGLPSLDLHGFAVDPRNGDTLYAAVAGEGLYRSTDAGDSFALVTTDVGASVFGLAVLPAGRILAADPARGVLASDDRGQTWKRVLREPALGVAVSPGDGRRVLATGRGIFLSRDGGNHWTKALAVEGGAGPVAWAPGNPSVAYAIGGEQATLYATRDGGRTWRAVR